MGSRGDLMTKLGGVELGGAPESGSEFQSAAAFWTDTTADMDFRYRPDDGPWEAVVKAGSKLVVARSRDKLGREEVISNGFELCQRCLDIVAYRTNSAPLTKQAGDDHVLLFSNDNRLILQYTETLDFKAEAGNPTIVAHDKDGNIVPPAPESIVWTPALRYYRLSQASHDLFDAYRNLWLAFESLLHEIDPKAKGEREEEWLTKALHSVEAKIRLFDLAPDGCSNPADYLVGPLYKHVRVGLFHSKFGRDFLPHSSANPTTIAEAYRTLVTLLRRLTKAYSFIRGRSGLVASRFFEDGLGSGLTT